MSARSTMKTSLPWLVLGIVAAGILAFRLQLSFDISAFFPATPDLQHRVLLQQFQSGPASRLLVIGINGADEETLADASEELHAALSDAPEFSMVMNGEVGADTAGLPEPLGSYYLLLQDIDYTAPALADAVTTRLQDLALGGGAAMLDLVARDPYLVTLDIAQRLAPAEIRNEMWFAADGSAVLMAETRATAVDIGAQAAAMQTVRDAFAALEGSGELSLEMTGAGAFGVELQDTIRAEAQKRSIMATAALLLVLFVFYRRASYLLLAGVPIGMGFLVGLATVALFFDEVHGITLAFGFTLMGVAIDYPLHLFSHAERSDGPTAIGRIWPTMQLGAVSTIVAYLALAFSGSAGLAQLGLFTAVGIATAALVTRTWAPHFVADAGSAPEEAGPDTAAPLRFLPAIGLTGIALVAISQVVTDGLWDDRLASLSPVPAQRIADDNRLRSAAGTPDIRYQLFVHNPSLEALLARGEDVDRFLAGAREDDLLDDWQSLTQVLPPTATQAARQARIPAPEVLQEDLRAALAGTPFRDDAFDPFLAAADVSRTLPPMTTDSFTGTPLQSWRDAKLVRAGDSWVSLLALRQPDVAALQERIAAWGDDIALLDLHEASAMLMRDYRAGALTTVAIAALLIVALLWQQRRELRQVIWIALSVGAGLVMTIAVVVAVHNQLTVMHLVALLLVFGLGLDYSLFLGRTESAAERRATNKAVLACAVSTTLAFGILAGSSIPVLKFLGLTVAAGSASSYLVALAGTRARVQGWLQ